MCILFQFPLFVSCVYLSRKAVAEAKIWGIVIRYSLAVSLGCGLLNNTMVLYKEYPNLPHPPMQMIDQVIDQWINKHGTFSRVGDWPDLTLQANKEKFGMTSTIEPVSGEIKDWLEANVCTTNRPYSSWILRMLEFHNRFTGHTLYEKHLDSIYANSNKYKSNMCVLIYNFTNSIGDLVFYQEQGEPIIREDRPVWIGKQTIGNHTKQQPHDRMVFGLSTEIFRCRPPPKTWYLSRSDVIHSVENCNLGPRVALQLRLSKQELDTLFPDFL